MNELAAPIKVADVAAVIASMKESSPGPDGLRLTTLQAIPVGSVQPVTSERPAAYQGVLHEESGGARQSSGVPSHRRRELLRASLPSSA